MTAMSDRTITQKGGESCSPPFLWMRAGIPALSVSALEVCLNQWIYKARCHINIMLEDEGLLCYASTNCQIRSGKGRII